jgi:hypothetical protein
VGYGLGLVVQGQAVGLWPNGKPGPCGSRLSQAYTGQTPGKRGTGTPADITQQRHDPSPCRQVGAGLAEKTLAMTKPDWNYAPEWAQFLAQHRSGNWTWFEFEPVVYEVTWERMKGRSARAGTSKPPNRWIDTLQQRP